MGVRVILTTGGTGGHIFPALAVAEQLRREGAELLFVGSQYGSEAKLAKQAGLEFRGLPVRGVLGRGLRSVGALWGLFRAVFMARAIVKDFRPDAVIGFGAYASFPSLVAAKLSGVPIAVHEQNAMPGLTNRMLAKLAKRVFLSLPDVTGLLTRKRASSQATPCCEAIVESGKTLLGIPVPAVYWSWAAAQGAKAVNSVILASLERLTKAGIEIRPQTGSFDLERVLAGYRAHGVDASGVTPFIEDVAAAYQWADLVLCRAGATSVAELAVAGKPAVLVPFPYATHDHQTYNAQVMVDQGAALLVAEKDLPGIWTPGGCSSTCCWTPARCVRCLRWRTPARVPMPPPKWRRAFLRCAVRAEKGNDDAYQVYENPYDRHRRLGHERYCRSALESRL